MRDFMPCGRLTLVSCHMPMQSPSHSCSSTGRCKKSLMSQDKKHFCKKKPALQGRQKEELIHCLPLAGGCPDTFWKAEPQHRTWLNLRSCVSALVGSLAPHINSLTPPSGMGKIIGKVKVRKIVG